MRGRVTNKTGCIICGTQLLYLDTPRSMECYLCGVSIESYAQCIEGHFVCDSCHSLPAMEYIEQFCIHNESADPVEMSNEIMRNSSIKMHGPEHHFLVPAVLVSAYYNSLGEPDKKQNKLAVAKTRAGQILGGFCGFYGDCGAAVGTGIFMSLILNATPLSKNEWRLCNLMTSRSLNSIAVHGGPRCCKRNTYLAIGEAVQFLSDNFRIQLPGRKNIRCDFSSLNKECLLEACPFYADGHPTGTRGD